MKLKPQVAKIVAASREEVWGQVVQSDNLFLVLEVSVPQEHEAAPLGKEIIDTFFAAFGKTSPINLKTLKKLVFLKEGSFLDLKVPKGSTLNLLVCVLVDEIFYLLILGGGKAFLKRGEKMAVLLERQGSGSGILKEKDILVLASPKFSQVISFSTLKATLDLGFDERAENLAPLLHLYEDAFGAAAMILEFKKEEEVVSEEEEKEEEKKHFLSAKTPFSKLITKAKSLASFFKIKSSFIFPEKNDQREFIFPEKNDQREFILKGKLSPAERTKKTVLTVALILIGLLFVSIVLGWGKRTASLQEERFRAVFDLVSHQYEEGEALVDLNTQKSRELLEKAKETLESSKEEFRKGSRERKKIEELLKKVEEVLKQAEKVYRFSEVPLFFDPVFLKDKAFGRRLGLYKDSLVILDKDNNTLYSLEVKEKSGKILAGGEQLEGAEVVGIHGDKAYVLSDRGIVEINVKDQSSSVKIEKDEEWGEIVDLVAYRGNIYLLDKKEGIAKYLKTDEGLARRDYLAPGEEFDFSSASSMAIDGEIWVGEDREILRFSLGERQEFSPQGLKEALGGYLTIYTDDECENIYVLDLSQKRIVVLNKEGQYQASYEWEKLGEGEDMVVSEKERKILVLVEGKIYGIEIK